MGLTEIVLIGTLLCVVASCFFGGFLLYRKLKEIEEKISVREGDSSGIDPTELIGIAVANWRLENRLTNMKGKIDSKDYRRLINVSNQFKEFLERYNIKAEDYTGRTFNEGMSIDIVSTEDDSASERDYVKQTESPAIFIDGIIYKRAVVILARGTKNKSENKEEHNIDAIKESKNDKK